MRDNLLLAAGVYLASLRFTSDFSVPYIGAPLNVLVACAIGAFCSFSFGDKVETRRRVFGLFVTCMLMGAALTAVVNAALAHWVFVQMTDGLHAGLGAIISFSARFFLPWLADVIKHGKWLSWIPFLRRNKE